MPTAHLDDRARRLLQFLRGMQEMRTRPVRDVAEYPRVFWLSEVPTDDSRCGTAWTGDLEQREGAWLSLDRVDRVPPPPPPEDLEPWLDPSHVSDSSFEEPPLLDTADIPVEYVEPSGERRTEYEQATSAEHPQVHERFRGWLPTWQAWATRDRADAAAWRTYNSIYALYQEQRGQSETLEIVLALGLLRTTSGGVGVRRHIVTVGATVDLDLDTGRLTVKPDPENPVPRLDEDMLDPQDRIPGPMADTVRGDLELLAATFGDEGASDPIRAWTNAFRSDAVFAPDFDRDSAPGGTVVLAPALLVRRRGRESFLHAIDTVAAQLAADTEIPDTLAQLLVDPEHDPASLTEDDSAALAADDHEVYFPRPANSEQHEIVDRLRRNRVVVVQGPPGTGKTHTIANLVTDLLAHGQRVLITSHGSRALKVLKGMLPDEVRDLCVNLADTSTRGQGDLQRSVATIIDQVTRESVAELDREHGRLENALAQGRADRTTALHGLREIRQQETQRVAAYRGPYSGTPQQIAEQVAADEPTHGWIGRVDPNADRVTGEQIARLSTLLREVTDETRHAALPLPKKDAPTPDEFEQLAARRADLQRRRTRLKQAAADEFPEVDHLDADVTGRLQRLCDGLAVELREIASAGYAWTDSALRDLWGGREQLLLQTRTETARVRDAVRHDLDTVASHSVTGLSQIDVATESGHLHALADHLAAGGALRRLGVTTKPAREAETALTAVRVDGRSCTTAEDMRVAAAACTAELRLRELESRWGLEPGNDSQGVRAARVDAHLDVLDQVLALKSSFEAARSLATRIRGLAEGRWHDDSWVERLADHLTGGDVDRKLAETEEWAQAWAGELRRVGKQARSPEPAESAAAALESWDTDGYAGAWPALKRGWDATQAIRELGSLEQQMRAAVPELVDAIAANPDGDLWNRRAHSVDDAYAWAEWDAWLRGIVDPSDESSLRTDLDRTDAVIKRLLLQIAANRAWRFCQSRMTPAEQQNLKLYATSTKKIGKGTGKYANQHRREARKALAKAQTAVPAWIMPLRSVVDTVPFERPGIFDVVIVDEASQSGHEALLLLWLGKRVLVVGDDEQISPESIGLDHEGIFHQRDELLYDLPTKANFGPTHSFLDHAETLAPNPVTLLEHFRCMPEIIGFSNGLSYHHRLLPVRQFGLDRLEPLRSTYIANGRLTGRGQRATNRPEAMQIVETIEKCCADPAYDNRSMGVITFLGSAQARLISDLLLDRLGPIEMENRALRVDRPEAFQGDERDVIFLSLVATPEGEDGPQRIGTMARRSDQQRLNVAASRARDQVWVFHSVRPENLSGGDFRRRYLEYLAEPVVDHVNPALGEVLPDVPHPAFESVFEQRVYLAVTGRGYRVRPQYPAGRYRIDLVVQGGSSRLAVECDGDAYHDAEAEADDILRQRELERLGWRFWRVRGSQFFRDPDASLAGLWDLLDELGIEPQAAAAPATVHEEVVVPDADGGMAGMDADGAMAGEEAAVDDATDVPAPSDVPSSTEASVSSDAHASSDVAGPPDDRTPGSLPDSAGTRDPTGTQPSSPVAVPEGAVVMGPASHARLQQEAEILEEELRRGDDTVAADARVRASVSREWQRRKERLAARLQHVRSVLDHACVVPVSELGGDAWPGAVVQCRDEGTGEVFDAVVTEVDLADETTDKVSPGSPLGKLLTGARAGQRLSYTKPNGEPAVVEIVAITD